MHTLLKRNLFLILFTFVLFFACRKTEQVVIESKSAIEAKFFKTLVSTDPLVISVSHNIERQNEKRNFVDQLSKKAGLPNWDKATVVKVPVTAQAKQAQTDADAYQLFIPFVKENTNYVNAVLIVSIEKNDTTFKLVYGSQYARFGFKEKEKGKWNAKDVFHIFALFNKQIFGHTKFLVKDKRLFPDNTTTTPDSFVVNLKDSPPSSNTQNRIDVFTVCNDFAVEVPCKAFRTTDEPYICYQIKNYCTTYWVVTFLDDGNNGGGGAGDGTGGGGGGTGGGGTGWENGDPCQPDPNEPAPNATGFCDPAWEPVPIDPFYDYENLGYKHLERGDVSPEDQLKMDFWKDNNIDKKGLDSCRKILLDKLISNLSGNMLGKILTKMDRSIYEKSNLEKFQITYVAKPLSAGSVAETGPSTYNSTTKFFSTVITIDSAKAKSSTDIYLAGTILHETIHAYMMSLLVRVKFGATLPQLQRMSYDSLFSEFVDTLVSRNSKQLTAISNDPQNDHNYMANKLINSIAEALKLFDSNAIANDNYYWYLAWKGLYKTKTWEKHWPNYPDKPITGAPLTTEDSTRRLKYALTPIRLDSIITVIYNEREANADSKGRKPVAGGCY